MTISPASWLLLLALVAVVGLKLALYAAERWPIARSFDQVTIDGMVVHMKVGYGRAKPEFEDIARIATVTGAAIHEVASRAEEAWRVAQRGPVAGSLSGSLADSLGGSLGDNEGQPA